MQARSTGWRSYAPAPDMREPYSSAKDDLFMAARLAGRALKLPAGCRFVLDQLCASYGGELVEGRMMVWPSNDYLEARTGIPERTIRHALRRLILEGVIAAKDSPNAKRYAQRDRSGRILRAFGFDLTPLLQRLSEFKDRIVEREARAREDRALRDQITVARRNAQEALRALSLLATGNVCSEYEMRLQTLSQRVLRHSETLARTCLDELLKIRTEIDQIVLTATGGNICRHKDRNTKAPESPCNSDMEDVDGEAGDLTCRELMLACPDADELLGGVHGDRDLIELTGRYRGAMGVSRDAWAEAVGDLGLLMAGAVLIWCIQIQAKPAPGATPVQNLGGYFRVMCRKVSKGDVDMSELIRRRL